MEGWHRVFKDMVRIKMATFATNACGKNTA